MIRRTLAGLGLVAVLAVANTPAALASTGHSKDHGSHVAGHKASSHVDGHKQHPDARVRKHHPKPATAPTASCHEVCVPKPRKPGAVSCKPHCKGNGPKVICTPKPPTHQAPHHPPSNGGGHHQGPKPTTPPATVTPHPPIITTVVHHVKPHARVRLTTASANIPNLPRTGGFAGQLAVIGGGLLGLGILTFGLGSLPRRQGRAMRKGIQATQSQP